MPDIMSSITALLSAILLSIAAAVLLLVVVRLVLDFIVCLVLYLALRRVPREHRELWPWTIWLLMVPLWSTIWMFVVVNGVSRSFRSYFRAQQRGEAGDCGYGVGLAYCLCGVLWWMGAARLLLGYAGLVLLILYVLKIHNLKLEIPRPVRTPAASPPTPA